MKVELDTATTIQVGNALRSYADKLREDAATYRRHDGERLAADAEKMADRLHQLSYEIDCGPIEIRVLD